MQISRFFGVGKVGKCRENLQGDQLKKSICFGPKKNEDVR